MTPAATSATNRSVFMSVSSNLIQHLLLTKLYAGSFTDVLHNRASEVSKETFAGRIRQGGLIGARLRRMSG